MRESVLQDFVVPVCLYEEAHQLAHLRHLIGTAFFVSDHGLFLTARHVVEQSLEMITFDQNLKIGLVTKPKANPLESTISPVVKFEFAQRPFDVAIGMVNYQSQSWFKLFNGEISGWRDIATLGYPISALNDAGTFNMHLRMLKGYVQRSVEAGELPSLSGGCHPDCFEVSFPITLGFSGAPLFVPAGDQNLLIGVCVGSVKSEIVEYSSLEVSDDGARLKESVSRIEQYGIAHSLKPLSDWRPSLAAGAMFSECVSPSSSS